MKNNYVKIGMLIIIVVVVALGVYEVLNSVMFNNKGKAIPAKHQNIIELIESTNSIYLKNEKINYFINENIIL